MAIQSWERFICGREQSESISIDLEQSLASYRDVHWSGLEM